MSITYSECVLVMQQTKLMRRIKSSVASMALPHFPALFHTRHVFREKLIEQKMCVLRFSTNFVYNFFHSTQNRGRYYHKCT